MHRWLVVVALVGGASQAHASETPLYQPAPAWVKPASAPPAGAGDDAPLLLVADTQERLAGGQVWTYREVASRAVSAQALAQIGTVKLTWLPDHGDLIVHRVDILRGRERINTLGAGSRFTVLHREQQLEQLQMDGLLTATLAVEGLQIGDVLDVAYSITDKDAALRGNVQAAAPLPSQPLKVGYARTRLLWPADAQLKWRAYPVGAAPVVTTANGWTELAFALPLPKQPELPRDVPQRFTHPPIVEASSFADWRAVSRTMAPLFVTDGLIAPGGALAREVATIAAAPDPLHRAALALASVQGKVRYLFRGMDNGNYVPQSPERTWALRYGDCKAKTLLLLAMLHKLGIEAEPVLANLGGGGFTVERLPSAEAFNHILVRATIGDRTLWLDGTGRGTTLEDMGDVPPLHTVLPLRPAGADLLAVASAAHARPDEIGTLDLDAGAGIDLPAPFTSTYTFRGGLADALRTAVAQAAKENRDKLLDGFGRSVPGIRFVADRRFSFDPATGAATVTLEGVASPQWRYEDHRYRFSLNDGVGNLSFTPDRSRPAWRDLPVSTGEPTTQLTTFHLRLPDGGHGFTLDGDQAVDLDIAAHAIEGRATLTDGTVVVQRRVASTGAEIASKDIAATRARLAAAQSRALRVATAPDYPAPWAGIELAKRAHRFTRVEALYAAYIADKPDEANRYLMRAAFRDTIFDRAAALADLDKAIGIEASGTAYRLRAAVREQLGQDAGATADLRAALDLDPGSRPLVAGLAHLLAIHGGKDQALALVQERIDQGGADQADYMETKASVLADVGDKAGALATIDGAIAIKPASASLFNERCWIKGTLATAVDTALADCTRSIELSGADTGMALDSRAMAYLRLNRLRDAEADLDAALALRPSSAASLFLRGVVRTRLGDRKAADADLAAARLLSPRIDETYARYGLKAA
jgi:tetratricopeptide (TPR) repeat protein